MNLQATAKSLTGHYWLLAIGYWLLAIGYWLLAIGYWLLAIGSLIQDFMNEPVTIIECPRDAWQGLAHIIPTATKAAYLRALINAGFTHIDAVSFVSPAAVPQMADSERVLELLDDLWKNPAEGHEVSGHDFSRADTGHNLTRPSAPEGSSSSPPPQMPNVEVIGIVVNRKGAARAIATGRVSTLGFPYSISPEFLRRNQNQSPEESLQVLGAITRLAEEAGRNLVAYVSMAFGNPYGDSWSIDAVRDACRQITHLGIWQISLADTVGLATPDQIAETVSAAIEASESAHIGVHLHARRDNAPALIRAAYNAGCRRFDSAIGGLGGCPFAQDDLVGNIPTEVLLATLADCGATLPDLALDEQIILSSHQIAAA